MAPHSGTTMAGKGAETPPWWRRKNLPALTSDSRKVKPGYLFAALTGKQDRRRALCEGCGGARRRRRAGPPAMARRRRRRWACASSPTKIPAPALARLGRGFLWRPARDRRGRHRHQGQVLHRRLPARDLDGAGQARRQPGHGRRGRAEGRDAALAHHARSGGDSRIAGAAESRTASSIWPSKPPAMAWISTGWTACQIAAGGFTNITRDHMDYHPTFEHYLPPSCGCSRKCVKDGGVAVVNADAEHADRFIAAARDARPDADHGGPQGRDHPSGSPRGPRRRPGADLALCRERFITSMLPLAGGFQASNALVAAGLAIGLGEDAGQGLRGAGASERRAGPDGEGRLRRQSARRSMSTTPIRPDSLEKVLEALRPHTANRLHVVFGCGGDRDKGKRPLMGAIAVEAGRRCDRHRRQSPQRRRRRHPQRNPGGGAGRARDRRPRRGHPRRRGGAEARAMCWSSPARAMRPANM